MAIKKCKKCGNAVIRGHSAHSGKICNRCWATEQNIKIVALLRQVTSQNKKIEFLYNKLNIARVDKRTNWGKKREIRH